MSDNIGIAETHIPQLKTLSEILSKEQEIFSQYFEILSRHHWSLVENDVEGFQSGIDTIDALSSEASRLEKERHEILTSLTAVRELQSSETLKNTIQELKALNFETLELLKDKMIGVHKKIMASGRRNGHLIAESASVLRQTIDPAWNIERSETAIIKSKIETGSVVC